MGGVESMQGREGEERGREGGREDKREERGIRRGHRTIRREGLIDSNTIDEFTHC